MRRKIRVLTIFGTRPEAIKLAPVIRALENQPGIENQVCVTGQHREMLDQVLSLFSIHPQFDLKLMRSDQSLSNLTAAVFTQLPPILEKVKPDWVLVQGDTTTVMAASLAAFYANIRVGHVEAGLRTGDKRQPFPEEINRRVASVVADLHFAPTQYARRNLLREGISEDAIFVTGNTVIDALNLIKTLPIDQATSAILDKLGIITKRKKLILVTAHRRENFGEPMRNICEALKRIAAEHADEIEILYPVHLNPNVWNPVHELLGNCKNITLIEPQEYLSMVHLLMRANLVLTDSGGVQEETTGLGVPCLVLRNKTERPEGVEAGVLKLVGTDSENIVNTVNTLLTSEDAYQAMRASENPFGDGHAAERIVRCLLELNE